MDKKKIALSFFIAIFLIIAGVLAYYYFKPTVQFTPGSGVYIYQINRADVDDQVLISTIGRENLTELADTYVRIKGDYSMEKKLTDAKIDFVTIPDVFPQNNYQAIYIVKISDNFLESKLQEIARTVTILQKKYDWTQRKQLDSTVIAWGTQADVDAIKSIRNVDYVTEYRLADRFDPQLVKLLKSGQSAQNVKIQIYDIYKYRGDFKKDPFIKELQKNSIGIKSEPTLITLESSGIGKEYIVEANLTQLVNLVKQHPEIIRVF